MSPPRSNLIEASVFRLSALLVRLTEAGWKYALSNTIRVVPARISELPPPITPPSAVARSASAMTSMSGSRRRSTPSRVVSVSPGSARRMTSRPPSSRVRRTRAAAGPSRASRSW